MRRVIVGLLTVVLVAGAGAYAVADVRDVVPGVLTRDDPVPTGLAAAPGPMTAPPPATTAAPDPAALQAALAPVLALPVLGSDVGVVVRDAETQTVLFSRAAEASRVLASLQKILTSVLLADTLRLDDAMVTKVVAGGAPGEIVLVAGGDTLLAKGAGDPQSVVGRAGLADLATQVAAAVPAGPLTLRLDASYAAGPRTLATWDPADVQFGFTRGVAQIGLADLRPIRGRVPATETDGDVLTALAEALRAAGRTVDIASDPTTATVASQAKVLGSVKSATYLEVIAHGLAESDNALFENLARQAMAAHGEDIPADGGTGVAVLQALQVAGVDTAGVAITDASGLSPRQLAPLRAIDQVLALGTDTNRLPLRRIIAELPVAGLSGTLAERFASEETKPAAGIPRVKTGSLTGVTSLAGTTVDADGRLLTFAIVSDSVSRSPAGTKDGRAALDRFAAVLTACGCR